MSKPGHLNWQALAAPIARCLLKMARQLASAVAAAIPFQMVGPQLVPVTLDHQPVAIGTVGALMFCVVHVA